MGYRHRHSRAHESVALNVEVRLFAKRPLGRILGPILEVFESRGYGADRISLQAMPAAAAESSEDLLARAASRSSGTCELLTSGGRFEISWNYGPRAWLQGIWGELQSASAELEKLGGLLLGLAEATGGVYGYADSKRKLDQDSREIGGLLLRQNSLVSIYWLNYFGPEIAAQLSSLDELETALPLVRRGREGGLLVAASAVPGRVDERLARSIAERWPVFAKLTRGARFPSGLELDLSQVRSLSEPASKKGRQRLSWVTYRSSSNVSRSTPPGSRSGAREKGCRVAPRRTCSRSSQPGASPSAPIEISCWRPSRHTAKRSAVAAAASGPRRRYSVAARQWSVAPGSPGRGGESWWRCCSSSKSPSSRAARATRLEQGRAARPAPRCDSPSCVSCRDARLAIPRPIFGRKHQEITCF